MTVFYAAVEGDPLDSGEGGYVYATKKTIGTIEDENGRRRSMIFIGDVGCCAKCKSLGAITFGAGGTNRKRMVDLVNGGRLQAMGGDVVLCKCDRPPQVIAVYGRKFTIIEGTGSAMPGGTAGSATSKAAASVSSKSENVRHVRWFYVSDAVNSEPLRHRDYVANVGGTKQFGKTDRNGYAKIETDEEQPVDIHALFSSPRRTLKPFQEA